MSIELTTLMLATLFDFPLEDRKLLTWWSDVATRCRKLGRDPQIRNFDDHGRAGKMLAYFTRLWNERVNAPPRTDLVSMLAHGPATRNMTPMEFMGNLVLLIVGGNDTTRNSMTGGLLALSQNPQEWAKLRANPALVGAWCRRSSAGRRRWRHMRRTAVEDFELGQAIRKGDKVVMWYLSGNRDESPSRTRGLHHRPRPAAPAPLVRLRHPPLRGQPPGRAAAAHPVGGDPAALRDHRGGWRAPARALQLRARLPRAARAHSWPERHPQRSTRA